MLPVIDLFAGPGGLSEGFGAFRAGRKRVFRIALSIEKDPAARDTLRLRSFFRQFPSGVPDAYYDFLRGSVDLHELYRRYPDEAARANEEAWLAELGKPEKYPIAAIDERIAESLDGAEDWVLIGGPPCQAYSVVGRSRMAQDRKKYEKDDRHFLYREYLRIIAIHRPPVFVMENVKGILSTKVEGSLIIDRILSDLKRPCEAIGETGSARLKKNVDYELYPFASYGTSRSLFRELDPDPSGYVIRTERHGIPQARHRLILLGIRSDLNVEPTMLPVSDQDVPMWRVIRDLPRLRSALSRGEDSPEDWVMTVRQVSELKFMRDDGMDADIWHLLRKTIRRVKPSLTTGGEFVPSPKVPVWQYAWFYDPRLGGVCNHATRAHMPSDLWRYFFAACFARVRKKSPLLTEFPACLLPEHKNAKNWDDGEDLAFEDRFRVQVKHRPSTTITAHMSKDGHYFIHPDPIQCRSLTVREAARLQSVPDSFMYECGVP
jgi:DNA (cytosine-5)-methyltransferase 1